MDMFGGRFGGAFGGFGGFMGQGGPPGMMGFDGRFAARPEHYDEFFKAYSMAMLPGKERPNVSYGGNIIMAQSALERLTQMDIESPYLFEISNTGVNLADTKTSHAGVLEFIADEGHVHLPAWMMRQLGLGEGDPIRLRGKTLPKGKFVKIEPQTVDFLEISDPKAVLEAAMRNFPTLTKGDIIEFSYNYLTFEIKILETQPDAEGISILNTDLEVDFAPPKGYVEPKPQPRAPPPTMASKLNIDTGGYESITPSGTSTPRSHDATGGGAGAATPIGESGTAASNAGAGPSGGARVASFQGTGQSLSGKKPKARTKEKPIEAVAQDSLVRRTTDKPRIVTNDTQIGEKKVPAALNLPFGKLFFGYSVVPLGGNGADNDKEGTTTMTFSGSGQTLSGRAPRAPAPSSREDDEASSPRNGAAATAAAASSSRSGQTLGGGGRTLGSSGRSGSSRKAKPDVIEVDDDDED